MGPRAIAVIINHGAEVASTTVIIPTATKIANCKTIRELVTLASGGLAKGGMIALQAATALTRTGSTVPQAVTTTGLMAGTTHTAGTMAP